MAAIGFVNGTMDTGYVGELRTLSIRVPVEIRRNAGKEGSVQPDYRIYSDGVEVGAGWIRIGAQSGKAYVSLTFETPEFGPRRLYANLARLAGQDNGDSFVILWNAMD